MTFRLLTALAAGAAVLTTGLEAQRRTPSVPQSLSLEDALSLGNDFNPTYRQTRNDHGPAAWGLRNAYAGFLPTLGINTSASYTGSGSQRFLSQEFETSPTIGSFYSLALNWQFDGTTLMQPVVQKAALSAVDAQIDAAQMNNRNQIVQQYLTVLENQAQVDLQTQQQQRNLDNLRLATARQEVGLVTMLDVRTAEVAKGQSDIGLIRGRQSVTVEKLRLFQLMGVDAPDDPAVVTLSDTFPIVEPDWELSDLLAAADVYNPDVLQLRAQQSSAEWNARATKSQWIPSLNFNASWSGFTQQFTNKGLLFEQGRASGQNSFDSCTNNNQILGVAGLPLSDCNTRLFSTQDSLDIIARNSVFPAQFTQQPFRASVSISYQIFDQFNRNLQNSRASVAADDAREARRGRELQVRTDVSQQHFGLLAAYQAIQIQESNRVSASEQLRLARERYRLGPGTFIELLDAQVANQQAEADYITSVYGYHRALASLEAAVGQSLR